MFKNALSIAATLTIAASAFAGCSAAPAKDDGKLNVVCTIFPIYDWTRNIIDPDTADISCLITSGADLHSYQPTAEDIMKISDCDVFIYVGGESDKWVDGALSSARNKDMAVIDLMDVLGSDLCEEELKEGMQSEEEEEEEDEDEPEYDEHIWLSLRSAEKCTNTIAAQLADADSEHADTYRNNASAYVDELEALDAEFTELTASAKNKTLIFGDRFPFRYLVDDYGLDYYAAFIGCSSESEASFETITFLANKCDELGAEYVFTIDGSDCNIANAIISSTKSKSQKVLTLDSLQNVKLSDKTETEDYISAMKKNYDTLKEALN
ncbi:MAG: zinc ABC transporter substrate-binding protein [Ruminococcus sp.]|nr:zinc ABC transporter substrate-binding protein [Ruminococcus sp.]